MKESDFFKKRKIPIQKAYPFAREPYILAEEGKGRVGVYYFKRKGREVNIRHCKLNRFQAAIFSNLKGELSSNKIFKKLYPGVALTNGRYLKKRIFGLLKKWSAKKAGLIGLSREPLSFSRGKLQRTFKLNQIGLRILSELNSLKNIKQAYDSSQYHRKKIKDPCRQFEKKEKTISHVLKDKNIILGSKTYGERFIRAILAKKHFDKKLNILEVGAGLGWLGYNAINYLKQKNKNNGFNYVFLDLSPQLLANQKRLNCKNKESKFVQAKANYLPFKPDSFDLLIANECVADFSVVKLKKKDILLTGKIKSNLNSDYPEAVLKAKKYLADIETFPPEFIFPLGIARFLEEIKRVLKQGAMAVLVEYGSLDYRARQLKLSGHIEYSIDFKMVSRIAQTIGFKVESLNICDFLKIRKIPLLSRSSKILLNKYLRANKRSLKKELYTRHLLREELGTLLNKIKNIQFVSARQAIDVFDPAEFRVLLLYA